MIPARRLVVLLGLCWVGCERRSAQPVHRVELRKTSTDLVAIVPHEGVPPYCLIYSIAEGGIIRQLTMNETNDSFECPPGEPIGNASFRIPKARIFVIFSDQKLAAATIAQQISDLGTPDFSALDLRVPGKAVSDVIEYTP